MALPVLSANTPVAGSISWTAFGLAYRGKGYAIPAGSTARTYTWWPYNGGAGGPLQSSDTLPALSVDDCLLFLNKSGAPVSIPTAQAIDGSLLVNGSVYASAIAAGSITTSLLAANTITADKIAAGAVTTSSLAADAITGKTITGGSINGAVITGATIQTAASGIRVALNDGGAAGDRISFYPGSGVSGELPGYLSTSRVSGRQALTLRSPVDSVAANACYVELRSSVDSSTSGVNGPMMTFTSGILNMSGDLQISGQSVARGLLAFTSVYGVNAITGLSGGGAEAGVMWTGVLTPILAGRKYRIRWFGNIGTSDNSGQLIVSRLKVSNPSGTVYTNASSVASTGNAIATFYNGLSPSFIGANFQNEVIFYGGNYVATPGTNQLPGVPPGNYDFGLSWVKYAGSANTATLNLSGPSQMTIEDIGT